MLALSRRTSPDKSLPSPSAASTIVAMIEIALAHSDLARVRSPTRRWSPERPP